MTEIRELTTFDKICLAHSAVQRAKQCFSDSDRFHGEFETARLWKTHNVNHCVTTDGRLLIWSAA